MLEKTILVIDDVSEIRELISQRLVKSGYRVITATDGLLGIESIEQHSPNLILLDISMPNMDGLSMLGALSGFKMRNSKKQLPPVILISGEDKMDSQLRAQQFGAIGFISKPLDMNALVSQIENYFNFGDGTTAELPRVSNPYSENKASSFRSQNDQISEYTQKMINTREAIHDAVERASYSAMFAKISHDINNSLTIIKGYALELDDQLARQEAISKNSVTSILNGVARLEQCSDFIRRLARSEKGSAREQNINLLVDETVDENLLALLYLEKISPHIDLAPKLPEIAIAGSHLHLLLLCLINMTLESNHTKCLTPNRLTIRTGLRADGKVLLTYQDSCSDIFMKDGQVGFHFYPAIELMAKQLNSKVEVTTSEGQFQISFCFL